MDEPSLSFSLSLSIIIILASLLRSTNGSNGFKKGVMVVSCGRTEGVTWSLLQFDRMDCQTTNMARTIHEGKSMVRRGGSVAMAMSVPELPLARLLALSPLLLLFMLIVAS